MLRLQNISLLQFKTYNSSSFFFDERIIAICGSNGIGKTNLLDAIYYLCFTKSYFSRSDQQNVQTGTSGFRLTGGFLLQHVENEVVCILRENNKKEFFLNDETYAKFSSHIGKFPCVIITPDDVQMITAGSDERRRFIDTLLCQLDAAYMQALIAYTKILQQRNGYLKSLPDRSALNHPLLDVYDEQLVMHGEIIFARRKAFLQELLPLVKTLYREIAATEEPVELCYNSQLLGFSLPELLRQNRERDAASQRTGSGIHKDDIEVTLHDQPFKNIASQGQRKSLLFAMKLAEFDMLKKEKGFSPLLLLDDVFEKLDEDRMYNLLKRVCLHNDGQLFITDTHEERIRRHFEKLNITFQLITQLTPLAPGPSPLGERG